MYGPRSKTTSLTPALEARSAISLPTAAAAETSAPVLSAPLQVLVERRGGGQRVALRVIDHLGVDVLGRAIDRQPRTRAGHLLELAAHTLRRAFDGFFGNHFLRSSAVYATGCGACAVRLERLPRPQPPRAYFFLPSLRTIRSSGIFHALALVGLGSAELADLRRDLADRLLVDARHDDLGRLRHRDGDAGRRLVDHVMAEAERQLQVLALHGRAIADAVDLQPLLEAVRHAGEDVGDLGARHAPFGARVLGLVARIDLDLAVFQS